MIPLPGRKPVTVHDATDPNDRRWSDVDVRLAQQAQINRAMQRLGRAVDRLNARLGVKP